MKTCLLSWILIEKKKYFKIFLWVFYIYFEIIMVLSGNVNILINKLNMNRKNKSIFVSFYGS